MKSFTKESIREKHLKTINEILEQGKGAEEITNYIMSRISNVISYELQKYEKRIATIREEKEK